MVYHVAKPDEFLAITGIGIDEVKICKKAWVWPMQKVQRFSVQPFDYALDLQAMTKEKLQFLLPVVFTIGPDTNKRGANDPMAPADVIQADLEHAPTDKNDALMKYAMLLADADNPHTKQGPTQGSHYSHIQKIIKGIIEGETRVLISAMSMEEIFTERDEFKKRIFKNIQGELDLFGLKIYNANVKELKDAPGSTYFDSLSKKAHEGAVQQAKVDVAKAQYAGTVGEAENMGLQNRDIAKIHAETAVQKTKRDTEKAEAEAKLATNKTQFNREVNIAQIEATRATEVRDEELRKEVEVKRAQTELERLRATDVVKATVAKESKKQAADAKNYEQQVASDASMYAEQKAADAHAYSLEIEAKAQFKSKQQTADAQKYEKEITANADFITKSKAAEAAAYKVECEAAAAIKSAEADYFTKSKAAEAELIRQQKEAAGLSAMASAYADLSHAFGGPAGLIQYMMIKEGVYTDLAKANADAVRGLAPKMTIWNTGTGAGGEDGAGQGCAAAIRNIHQMLPPLMTTIKEQTGSADISYIANVGGLGAVVAPRKRPTENGARDS